MRTVKSVIIAENSVSLLEDNQGYVIESVENGCLNRTLSFESFTLASFVFDSKLTKLVNQKQKDYLMIKRKAKEASKWYI